MKYLAQGLPVQILAVAVDVVVRHLVERIGPVSGEPGFAYLE